MPCASLPLSNRFPFNPPSPLTLLPTYSLDPPSFLLHFPFSSLTSSSSYTSLSLHTSSVSTFSSPFTCKVLGLHYGWCHLPNVLVRGLDRRLAMWCHYNDRRSEKLSVKS